MVVVVELLDVDVSVLDVDVSVLDVDVSVLDVDVSVLDVDVDVLVVVVGEMGSSSSQAPTDRTVNAKAIPRKRVKFCIPGTLSSKVSV
ncbi:MAG: hypothetical protein ACREMK_01390 [Gemmatimonadota bacterium]